MSEIDKKRLGLRIKQIRVDRRETLEEFANNIVRFSDGSIKTTKSNVSKWEKGLNVPNAIALEVIAKLGGMTVDFLVSSDYIMFDEFSEQIKIENSVTRIWLENLINNYFEREKDNNDFQNSYEYELNTSLLFIFQEYHLGEESHSLGETKNKILERVKSYLLEDNYTGWLYSFYEFYIDDIEGRLYIDKTMNEILVNIAMENRYIYITYLEKLVKSVQNQLIDNSFKIKKKTLNDIKKERTTLISQQEHVLISEKFNEIISTIREFL